MDDLRTEHSGARIEILKCKGHAKEADIDEGRATRRTKNGNDAADTFAVRGTIVAEARAPPSQTPYKLAISYYRFLLWLCTDWVTDTTPYDDWLETQQPLKKKRRWTGTPSCTKRHRIA